MSLEYWMHTLCRGWSTLSSSLDVLPLGSCWFYLRLTYTNAIASKKHQQVVMCCKWHNSIPEKIIQSTFIDQLKIAHFTVLNPVKRNRLAALARPQLWITEISTIYHFDSRKPLILRLNFAFGCWIKHKSSSWFLLLQHGSGTTLVRARRFYITNWVRQWKLPLHQPGSLRIFRVIFVFGKLRRIGCAVCLQPTTRKHGRNTSEPTSGSCW